MKNRWISLVAALLCVVSLATAQTDPSHGAQAYTIITNPGQDARREMRVNWHTDPDNKKNYCLYTKRSDTQWKKARKVKAEQHLCTEYDSLYSKKANGENFYERARFLRCTATLKNLEPDTEYMYRIGPGDRSQVHYFKTAPASGRWNIGIISDFHSYPPLPKRVEAAMDMVGTLENCNGGDLDFMLHLGDVCAWGGSYSFWKTLYDEPYFSKYMWAGVNGNHDNMDRQSARLSNQYFRLANNNPQNGYQGEEGVCYYFIYDNALFIILNNENMRTAEGLAAAQQWVREVIAKNPAKYIIVAEHYQWFYGDSGKDSQYARWRELFDQCGVDLALSGNNHIYARTNAIYQGKETDGTVGTVYIQTPSSDNERGRDLEEWVANKDLIKFRWAEGPRTVGAMVMNAYDDHLHLTLYDRQGNAVDQVSVQAKR